MRRPLGACVTTPFAARHSARPTPQAFAAAAMSISRALAPALRSTSCDSRMAPLLAETIGPQTRLRFRFSFESAYSTRTRRQSHSSSSATSCAAAVMPPWPSSARA